VFELNVTTEELRKSGTLIRLAPQPLKLLALLARRSGQVVTREEIQRTLWGGETYVDFEQGMNHCVKQIRNALSDSADTPLYIETVPRRGYRFLAPVVTKRIPAPPPRVVESQSGIQSGVPIPGGAPAVLSPTKPVVTDPTAAFKTHAAPAAPAVQQPAPLAVERSPAKIPWKIILIAAVVLAIVIMAIIFWQTRSRASLDRGNSMSAAHAGRTIKQAYAACSAGLRLAGDGFFFCG
jgi:DNA-binding winged helix-turn-helix (wHTH) protein